MKKFTILAIAALMSVIGYAQRDNVLPAAKRQAAELSLATPQSLQAHKTSAKLVSLQKTSKVKANLRKAPAKATSVSDLEGNYVMTYLSYFDDYAETTCNVTVLAGEKENEIIFRGWWGSWATGCGNRRSRERRGAAYQ